MGLKIYNSSQVAISSLGNEIATSHNGVTGESVDILLYLRNDDSSIYYADLTIQPFDTDSTDDTLGVYGTGRGIKLSPTSRQPTETEWENVIAGDFIIMDDVGSTEAADTTTYFPFWMRVIVPGNTPNQSFTDVELVISGTERVIGA